MVKTNKQMKRIMMKLLLAMRLLKDPKGSSIPDMVVALNVPEAQQETLYKELQQAVTRGVSIGFFRRNGPRIRLAISVEQLAKILFKKRNVGRPPKKQKLKVVVGKPKTKKV